MDKFWAELLKTTLLLTTLWNQYTTDREILAVKTFSPVAKVAKIKRVKFFLLIGHVAKIKHANTSYVEKMLCENFPIYGIHELSMNHVFLIKKGWPLNRMHFSCYQTSSAVLGGPGDGDCYHMHTIQ